MPTKDIHRKIEALDCKRTEISKKISCLQGEIYSLIVEDNKTFCQWQELVKESQERSQT